MVAQIVGRGYEQSSQTGHCAWRECAHCAIRSVRPAGGRDHPRIGFLGVSTPAAWTTRVDAFRAGLRDLGYVEGKNITIEFRFAQGQYERLPELAAELVRLKLDVIVTHSAPGAVAAKQATATNPIPVVMTNIGDPVGLG